MTTNVLNTHHHKQWIGVLIAGAVAGAGCVGDAADAELTTDFSALSATATAGATNAPPIIPEMEWLAKLPASEHGEIALARLFAHGTATYVPTGSGTGYPALFNSIPELNWLAAQLWGGKTFRVISSERHPNGDPIVALDNKIIKTPTGELLNLFDAYVTRQPSNTVAVGVNSKGEQVPAPQGTLDLVPISFLDEPAVIDDKPSIVLNYFGDKTLPVIRRIFDEIREIDDVNCKGLFLGRAHARRCVSLNCGEAPSPLVDFPKELTFQTRYEWTFWTYFILNFGQPDGQKCDIGQAVDTVKRELQAVGLGTNLPDAPSAN